MRWTASGSVAKNLFAGERALVIFSEIFVLVANLDGGRSYHLDNATFMLC